MRITYRLHARQQMAERGFGPDDVRRRACRWDGCRDKASRGPAVPQVAGFVHAMFSLDDPEELRGLLDAAGFVDVVVDRRLKTLRLPQPQDFLWQYIHSTPLADAVAQTGDEARAAIEQRVVAGCEPFVDEGALVMDVGMLTAIARSDD